MVYEQLPDTLSVHASRLKFSFSGPLSHHAKATQKVTVSECALLDVFGLNVAFKKLVVLVITDPDNVLGAFPLDVSPLTVDVVLLSFFVLLVLRLDE